MSAECQIRIRISSLLKVMDYLKHHEDDIADGIDDFSDLYGLYFDLLAREPAGHLTNSDPWEALPRWVAEIKAEGSRRCDVGSE